MPTLKIKKERKGSEKRGWGEEKGKMEEP